MTTESKYLQDYRQMQRSDFRYFTDMSTRWGDADALGHINNTLYARYYESGRVAYCSEILQMDFVHQMPTGVILADIKIAYIQQLHHPAELEIGSRISRIGNSSLDLDAAIFIKSEDQPISTSRAVVVWFDYKTNHTQAVPTDIREKLMQYEVIPPA